MHSGIDYWSGIPDLIRLRPPTISSIEGADAATLNTFNLPVGLAGLRPGNFFCAAGFFGLIPKP
jgi:hypothetical protein